MWQTLTYINSSNSHNYPKGRYIIISILQRTKVRHREVKYLLKIMRRINGALCPGGLAMEPELITMHEGNESVVLGKEKSNSSLFAKYVILYLEIPKESIEKLVKLTRLLREVLRA